MPTSCALAGADPASPCSADGRPAGSPLALCRGHLQEAYEWMAGEVGVTDVLPSPCVACGSRLGVRYPSGWLCARCDWQHGEHPEDGSAPVLVEVVYYLRFGDRLKIGTSGNPRSRLAQLRYEELLAFERGGRAREQSRHAQFAEHRLTGEWFALTGDLADHVAALTASGDDPWQLLARWRSEAEALRGR
ncbi:GIY-YIG nuclease family protein [Herbiconiux sp. YIM B11900]|uniref:GIY-YIG nuclease family protein n=1 Tax=Herbiconiux sp. YIM B11900 TaxID=3404131 RepID=UPI003F87A456